MKATTKIQILKAFKLRSMLSQFFSKFLAARPRRFACVIAFMIEEKMFKHEINYTSSHMDLNTIYWPKSNIQIYCLF